MSRGNKRLKLTKTFFLVNAPFPGPAQLSYFISSRTTLLQLSSDCGRRPLDTILVKHQAGLAKLMPHLVDGIEDPRPTHQLVFQTTSPREVEQHYAE